MISAPLSSAAGMSASGPAKTIRPSRAAIAPVSTMPRPGSAVGQGRQAGIAPDAIAACPAFVLRSHHLFRFNRLRLCIYILKRTASAIVVGMRDAERNMTAIFAEQALLPDGWHDDVRIIARATAASRRSSRTPRRRPATSATPSCMPGMPNLHSHAFQRGMAGLAEVRGPGADSFWTWREVMYRFALSMTPEQVEAVAAQLYVEMLEAASPASASSTTCITTATARPMPTSPRWPSASPPRPTRPASA